LSCLRQPLQFDFAWCACLYQDPLKDLIRQFKYNQKTRLRRLFARCVKDFVQTYGLDIQQFDCIVPIPLHPTRLRERGYNQALLLAKPIAREYGIPLSADNLVRARNTKQQTLLSKKERWTNIHRAFRIKYSAGFFKKNVLIIDDLLTTGATVSEAAGTLKCAGAKTVGVLTWAITMN
jgi:ComF family protein